MLITLITHQWRIQDFKLGGGAHLKKSRRAEEGAKIVGVFRVKNHDFTQKNHIFSNFKGDARGSAPAHLGTTSRWCEKKCKIKVSDEKP